MRVFAYCARQFTKATRRAAGISPSTCPPLSAETFWTQRAAIAAADLVYVDLHGRPGADAWYGDGGVVACTADQVRTLNLRGTVVFTVNCYVGDQSSPGVPGPMLEALLEAGAGYVIAGEGANYGPAGGPLYGAPLLGLWLRRFLSIGLTVPRAVGLGKRFAALRGGGRFVVEDVMAFAAIGRDEYDRV